MPGGDVHRHGQLGPVQGGDRGGRGVQDPAAQLGDQGRLLGQRDELGRGDRAPDGVLPAQQRLDRPGPLHRQVDDRLVDQPQLVPLEGQGQVGPQRLLPVRRDQRGHRVPADPAGAGGAGAGHRHRRAAQHLHGLVVVGLDRGGAGRGRQPQPEDRVVGADGGDQPVGQGLGIADRAGQQHGELLRAGAEQPVPGAQRAGEPAGHLAGHLRRCRGAAVGVGQTGHPDLHQATATPAAEGIGEPGDQRAAVGQAGLGVGAPGGCVDDPGGGRGVGPGDVPAVEHQGADVGVLAQVADRGLHQPPPPVVVADPGGGGAVTGVGLRGEQGGGQRGAVVGVHGDAHVLADQPFGVPAQEVAHARGDPGDGEPAVQDDHLVDRGADDRAEACLAALQAAGEVAAVPPRDGLVHGQQHQAEPGQHGLRHAQAAGDQDPGQQQQAGAQGGQVGQEGGHDGGRLVGAVPVPPRSCRAGRPCTAGRGRRRRRRCWPPARAWRRWPRRRTRRGPGRRRRPAARPAPGRRPAAPGRWWWTGPADPGRPARTRSRRGRPGSGRAACAAPAGARRRARTRRGRTAGRPPGAAAGR